MRTLILLPVLVSLAVAAFAAAPTAAPPPVGPLVKEYLKGGPCALQESLTYDSDKLFKVQTGGSVKAEFGLYVTDFQNAKSIVGQSDFTNNGATQMFFRYYLAFFDKDGNLVGAASEGQFSPAGMNAGEHARQGGCVIPLPPDKIRSIKTYKLAFYESAKPIGAAK